MGDVKIKVELCYLLSQVVDGFLGSGELSTSGIPFLSDTLDQHNHLNDESTTSSSYCCLNSSTLLDWTHTGGSGVNRTYGADDDAT